MARLSAAAAALALLLALAASTASAGSANIPHPSHTPGEGAGGADQQQPQQRKPAALAGGEHTFSTPPGVARAAAARMRYQQQHPPAAMHTADVIKHQKPKATECHPYLTTVEERPEDELDRRVGFDPRTGREAEAEDAAEDAIATSAKRAGMDPAEYEAAVGAAAGAGEAAAGQLGALRHGHGDHTFRTGYTLTFYYRTPARMPPGADLGEIALLKAFTSSSNRTLVDAFSTVLEAALSPLMPDGVADLATVNVITGTPTELDLVVYPDMLIPDQLNPTESLLAADDVMVGLQVANLTAGGFAERYGIADVIVQPHQRNEQEMRDCEELFPLPVGSPALAQRAAAAAGARRAARRLPVRLSLLAMLAAAAALAWRVLGLWRRAVLSRSALLPRYPGYEQAAQRPSQLGSVLKGSRGGAGSGSMPGCAPRAGSGAGAAAGGIAYIYAAATMESQPPSPSYAGPYRSAYGSGCGAASPLARNFSDASVAAAAASAAGQL